MKRKFLSIMSCTAMLAALIPMSASADSVSSVEYTLTADKTVIHPGDEVTFTLSIKPNGDLYAFQAYLNLPEGLEFKSAEKSSELKDLDWDITTAPKNEDGCFNGTTSSSPYTSAAELVIGTFTCTASDNFTITDGKTPPLLKDLKALGELENGVNKEAQENIDKSAVQLIMGALEHIDAAASTCVKAGNIEYYRCTCGAEDEIYSDAERQNKISLSDTVLPLAEHSFTEEKAEEQYLAEAANCKSPAKFYKRCSVCGEKGTETFTSGEVNPDNHVNTEKTNVKEATYEQEGYTGDTVCKDCGKVIETGETTPIKKRPTYNDNTSGTVNDYFVDKPQTPVSEPENSSSTTSSDVPKTDNKYKTDWDSIIEKIKSAAPGGKVNVNTDNNDALVRGDVFNVLKGKDVDLIIDQGGVIWTVNGLTVTGSDFKDVDLTVTKDTGSVPDGFGENDPNHVALKTFSIAHNGELGFTAVMRMNIGMKYAGLTSTLYRFDDKFNFNEADKTTVSSNGIVCYSFTHASDYMISLDKSYLPVDEPINNSNNYTSTPSNDTPSNSENSTPSTSEDVSSETNNLVLVNNSSSIESTSEESNPKTNAAMGIVPIMASSVIIGAWYGIYNVVKKKRK